MKVELDIKTMLIILFFTLSVIFGLKWYFGSNVDRDKVKELEKEFKELEKQKAETDERIKQWEYKFQELDKRDSDLREQQKIYEKQIITYTNIVNKDKNELYELKKKMENTRKKIEEFKKNPPNRTGEDLINSIKNKTE